MRWWKENDEEKERKLERKVKEWQWNQNLHFECAYNFHSHIHSTFHFILLSTYICSTCISQGETFLPLSLSSLSIFCVFTCDTSCLPLLLTQLLTSSFYPLQLQHNNNNSNLLPLPYLFTSYFLCMCFCLLLFPLIFSSFFPAHKPTTHDTHQK